MRALLILIACLGISSVLYAQNDENTLPPLRPKYSEELLKNKWWIPDPKKNPSSNTMKQKFMDLGKYRTIGTMTGSWGWRNKEKGVLYIDYVGNKWYQQIIKLTDNELVYERNGKKYYLVSK